MDFEALPDELVEMMYDDNLDSVADLHCACSSSWYISATCSSVHYGNYTAGYWEASFGWVSHRSCVYGYIVQYGGGWVTRYRETVPCGYGLYIEHKLKCWR